MQPVESTRPEDVAPILTSVAELGDLAARNAIALLGHTWSQADESALISDAAYDLLARTAG